MDKVMALTEADREVLAHIERAIGGAPSSGAEWDGREDVVELLLATQPQATGDFEQRLESRLMARLHPIPETRVQLHAWRRWGAAGALAILLIVVLALAAMGPRRVWAQVRHWLGYAPGIGFVDLDATRVLAAPVAATRDGVTLTVGQVLARSDETTVVFSSQGLPREDRLIPQGPEMAPGHAPRLRLPDGRELAPETFTLRWGGGTVVFPALPPEVYRVTLVVPTLPLVPAGAAPEDWEMPLALRAATSELVAELFPQPYTPPEAVDARHGVTLRVLEVAHSPDETALQLQLQWADPSWESHFIRGSYLPQLSDDVGHVYYEQVGGSGEGSLSQSVVVAVQPDADGGPEPDHQIPTLTQTVTFSPVSLAAQALTLTMGGFDFEVPAEAALTLDLGDDPQVGDVWPMDLVLDVAGVSMRVLRARLVNEELGSPEDVILRPTLWFDIVPVVQDGIMGLCGLRFDGAVAGFRPGSVGGYSPQSQQVRAGLVVEEGHPMPKGVIHVPIDGARLCLNDVWTVSWEIPSSTDGVETDLTPVVIYPTEAAQTRHGLTLQVEKVVLTDRLTHVQVGLVDPPAGTTLSAALRWNWPNVRPEGLSLTDDRVHTYAPARAVGWVPAVGTAPGQPMGVDLTAIAFEPLDPLARQLTLHVPAVEIVTSATAGFDVPVPDGLTPDHGDDAPWAVSSTWEVDIPVTLGEVQLHFTQAHLAELNGTTMLMLRSEPITPVARLRRLSGVSLAAVTGPDRRRVDLSSSVGGAGPVAEGDPRYEVWLGFDVVDPASGSVQPGLYRVMVGGARLVVEGDWTLRWELP